MFENGFWGADLFGLIMMIIFWAIIIWAIVAFIRWVTKQSQGREYHEGRGGMFEKKKDDVMDILNERYAKGEITKEEYEVRKKDLLEEKMDSPDRDRRGGPDRRDRR